MGENEQQLTLDEQLEQQNMTREDYVVILEKAIDDANGMKKLTATKEFTHLFEGRFIKDFALGTAQNLHIYKPETRERIVEKMVARSVFSKFIEQILNDGAESEAALKELREVETAEADAK